MSFIGVQEDTTNNDRDQELARAINLLGRGRLNVNGTLTIATGAATTTVQEAPSRLTIESNILFTPTTANAAAEVASGNFYLSSIDVPNQQFVVANTNSATADRDFNYTIIG